MSEQTIQPRAGLYLCCRTSIWNDGKPCDEAFQILVVNTDVRTVDDPKKIPSNRGTDGDWYKIGTNHRVENGMIRRDLAPRLQWAVEVSDINAFVERHGPCVLERDNNGFFTIEIYDAYRE